jgi:large subunit ribosomal protein L14
MIQQGTLLKVTDKTGVTLVQCIKVLGSSKKGIAYLGDVILVTVKKLNSKQFRGAASRKKRKFIKGTLHRGLIVRTKVNYKRLNGILIKFNENSLVLVNKRSVPISNRINGPILKELCIKLPSLGCVTRYMI